MATPDLTPYVDLRIFDRDPQDVFDLAIQNLRVLMPEWEPRETNTEVMLLESLSLPIAELMFAVNRLPGAITEILFRLYGIERDYGTPPSTTVTFTLSDNGGHSIPAGTRVRLVTPTFEPVVFTTDVDLDIAQGSITGTVAATGDRFTDEVNETIAGTSLEILDAITFVDRANTATTVLGGVSPEEDEEWLNRGVQRFARLSETLVLPKHFVAAALEEPYVTRAYALDNYNPAAGSGSVGSHPGYIAVAVYGDGSLVTTEQKVELDTKFEERAQANLAVSIIDPTVTPVDVSAKVYRNSTTSTAVVLNDVTAALQDFLSPMNWEWSGAVRRNEILAIISQVPGVAYVSELTTPATDITLTGVAPLTSPRNIIIEVINV